MYKHKENLMQAMIPLAGGGGGGGGLLAIRS